MFFSSNLDSEALHVRQQGNGCTSEDSMRSPFLAHTRQVSKHSHRRLRNDNIVLGVPLPARSACRTKITNERYIQIYVMADFGDPAFASAGVGLNTRAVITRDLFPNNNKNSSSLMKFGLLRNLVEVICRWVDPDGL